MLAFAFAALAQDVTLRDPLLTGTTATTVYGGTFTGAGWRVDDANSRLYWDLGRMIDRGVVSFTTDDITLANLTGDNNEFIQLFDTGDKWSCSHAVTVRVYGDLDGDSWGDIKLKTWDNVSGLYSEARGGVQDWDGAPHTWTVAWDGTAATLARDGVIIISLDVTGQDLSVGTLWLPLNSWTNGYSHPIGSVYSNLALDGWAPGGGDDPGDDTGAEPPDGGRLPVEDAGVVESYGGRVYDGITDLPLEGSAEAAYLTFDLSDLHGTVTSATLTLHAQSDSHAQGDGGAVYAVSDTTWTEDTLSWANRPALGARLGGFGAVAPGDAVVVDVTAGVTAGRRVGFAIADGGGDGVHFWSKEGDVGPTLAVTAEEGGGGDAGGDDTAVDDGAGGGDGAGGDDDAGTDGDTGGGPGSLSSLDAGAGCGCARTSPPAGLAGLLGALVLARRRGCGPRYGDRAGAPDPRPGAGRGGARWLPRRLAPTRAAPPNPELDMNLYIGSLAPDFEADTTHGPLRFHEWAGGDWVIFFSHPKDFTPVCTTELAAVARLHDALRARGAKALAISVDPVADHLRWIGDIEETQGIAPNFPIIGDPERKVSLLYGLIPPDHPDTFTVRSVIFIDPARKVRALITYPASTGRNFDELLRVLDSLQLTDVHKVATPANWRDGEDVVIVPSLQDPAELAARFPRGYRALKPYLRLTPQPNR